MYRTIDLQTMNSMQKMGSTTTTQGSMIPKINNIYFKTIFKNVDLYFVIPAQAHWRQGKRQSWFNCSQWFILLFGFSFQ